MNHKCMTGRDVTEVVGFDWDVGNINKSWRKNQVTSVECEEVFFNGPYGVFDDRSESLCDWRYYVLGLTDRARPLFLVCAIRANRLRVVSARAMNNTQGRTERELKVVPHFTSEKAERAFWNTADSTEYIDYSTAEKIIFPALCPSTSKLLIKLQNRFLGR
jgi:uncharacterized protein